MIPSGTWEGAPMPGMRRREFVGLFGGAAVAWPLPARAQEIERVRRIGIIFPAVADDPVFQAWLGAFLQALALLGWTIGRNFRIDTRWATANSPEIRQGISELLCVRAGRHRGLRLFDRGTAAAGDPH